jgi:eukaryotic-like serine/threonine-protein kinase
MSSPPGAGDRLAGHRLLRLLGEGAQSQVWLALPPGGGTLVALKIGVLGHPPSDAARQAFLAAARAAAALDHPDIVRIHDAGVEGDTAWLSMEAVPGCDLLRYTRAPRLLPPAAVLRLGARVAGALAHAHRRGIVHRDVKPANVLIDWASDGLRLVDFGLARAGGASHTGTGVVPGTPTYMAPELLAGAPASAASDLYALGAMLYELLLGEAPFVEASLGRLLQRVAHEPAPRLADCLPGLPPALDALLAALMAKSAEARPQSAAEVAQQLQALSDTVGDGTSDTLRGKRPTAGPMSR